MDNQKVNLFPACGEDANGFEKNNSEKLWELVMPKVPANLQKPVLKTSGEITCSGLEYFLDNVKLIDKQGNAINLSEAQKEKFMFYEKMSKTHTAIFLNSRRYGKTIFWKAKK